MDVSASHGSVMALSKVSQGGLVVGAVVGTVPAPKKFIIAL